MGSKDRLGKLEQGGSIRGSGVLVEQALNFTLAIDGDAVCAQQGGGDAVAVRQDT